MCHNNARIRIRVRVRVRFDVGNQPLIKSDLAPLPTPSKRVTFRLDRNTIRYLDN